MPTAGRAGGALAAWRWRPSTEPAWAYPVFTSVELARSYANYLTEDLDAEDAEEFRRETHKKLRRVRPKEIPRAAHVLVDPLVVREADRRKDGVIGAMMRWGEF